MAIGDYYRQFDDIDEAKLNLERRERRRREKAAALERAPDVDLSGTEWQDLPHSEIVNAAIESSWATAQPTCCWPPRWRCSAPATSS